MIGFAVGAYITAAYWFTASTSFANPAVTLARALTDTFAGIRPADAPGFVIAQLVGAVAATGLFRWLVPALPAVASKVVRVARGTVAARPRMNTVIFACVHNAGRSQMAAAFFNGPLTDRRRALSPPERNQAHVSIPRSWRSCARWESISRPRDLRD